LREGPATLLRSMDEGSLQLVRASGFVVGLAVAWALQRTAPLARLRGSWRVNGGLWLVNATLLGVVCGACGFTVAAWAARHHVGVLNAFSMPGWLGIGATIALLDLVSYGWHRANHRVAILWRFHQVHHSDPTFTTSTGLRFHPGELVLSLPLRLAAVVLLGAPPVAVLAFEVVFGFANLVEHGDINFPRAFERRLGKLCVTPALHRRHHTKVRPDRDRNFGTVFSVWDRLFGTFADNDSSTRIDTGLPDLNPTLSRALTLPLRPAA
jgi:sterol desaturase/sphingolipid hydroxylase (fatty acid hydroxylase superfamily)